ncbi:LON peptidase substrate-binding domain-containing protein [Ignatzschineria larvae]|uniref:LON peptidase substrate-binding domain-containing protein n=1 Tax=Ignatzschineria larvae TaxID=112009 RepID=UPI000416F941|nr:LON peptidase substrate-binding domain-containing protein [Ignatzschineria larvae]
MSDNKKTILPAVENEIKGHNEVIVEGDTISNIIHILPLHDRPFFPPQIAPLLLNEEPWLTTLDSIMDNRTRVVGLILSKKETKTDLTADDFYEYGTLIHIHHPHREDGKVQFIAQGIQRFRVKKWISKEIPFVAQVEYFDEAIIDKSDEVRAYSMAVVNALKELIPFNPLFSEELKHFLTRYNSNDPSPFADFAASMTTNGKEELQDVLSTIPLVPRLRKVLAIIEKEIKIAKLGAVEHS